MNSSVNMYKSSNGEILAQIMRSYLSISEKVIAIATCYATIQVYLSAVLYSHITTIESTTL